MKERILILCAHPDDEIIPIGGTIARYSKEGKKIKIIIFSSGEMFIPWFKERVIKKTRQGESQKISKIFGCETEFLDLPDTKISGHIEESAKKIKKISKAN